MHNTNVPWKFTNGQKSVTQDSESYSAMVDRLKLTILVWLTRHSTRQHLHELEHHLLDDVGLSLAEKNAEVAKYFWQQ